MNIRTLLLPSVILATAAIAANELTVSPVVEKPQETSPAATSLERICADKATLLLLEPDVMDLVDVSGHIPQTEIKVENGEIADDPVAGAVLRFGERPSTGGARWRPS